MGATIDSESSIDGKGVEAGVVPYEPLAQGQLLDERYELVSVLGEGTFGIVWSAIDRRLGLRVAVKLAKHHGAAELFELEIALLIDLQNPGVVVVRDRWIPSGATSRPYFVMEYCDSTLANHLKNKGPIPLAQARSMFFDLCRTVEFLHSKNKIHRDLKPSNVLIHQSGADLVPRIADFGIAREMPSRSSTATKGVGTETYKSPEIGLGRRPDGASDVFALAVILIEVLTTRAKPDEEVAWWQFVHSHDASIVNKRLQEIVGSILPSSAVSILARALSPAPENRPGAIEFSETFERVTRDAPASPERPRDHFFLTVAATNTLGYLLGTVPAIFIDPLLPGRYGLGARIHQYGWMIAPLALFIFVFTAFWGRQGSRRSPQIALVPLILAGIAAVPILATNGEIPHGILSFVVLPWIAFTAIWLGLRQILGASNPHPSQSIGFERDKLFQLMLAFVAIMVITFFPVLWFSNYIASNSSPNALETARLQSLARFHCAVLFLFWLAGPTREAAKAWYRAELLSRGRYELRAK